jgi:hypothetical protein
MWVYCQTTDDPKEVGEYICDSNFVEECKDKKSRIFKDESEDGCWLIQTYPRNETSAIIYRVGQNIIGIEIDDNCAVNVIEPLMKKYGFTNIRWLTTK